MIETLAYGYSFEGTQQELSMNTIMTEFKWFSRIALWTKIAVALEGLKLVFYFRF